MNIYYPIVGILLLAIIVFAPQLNEIFSRFYWYKNFRKLSCYQQAFFLYTLIRYYRIHPDAYTASRADRLKVYLRLYVTYKYPGCEAEIEMQSRMLNLWYLLKEQKTF